MIQDMNSVFCAVCSTCGAEGPAKPSTQEAHEAAVVCGWEYRTVYPEGHRMSVYTCNACLGDKSDFDNPPIYATPLDPDCEISDADPGL